MPRRLPAQPATPSAVIPEVEVLWPPGSEADMSWAWCFYVDLIPGPDGTLQPWKVSIERGGLFEPLSAASIRRIPFGAVFAQARQNLPEALKRRLDYLEWSGAKVMASEWDTVLEQVVEVLKQQAPSRPRRGGRQPLPPEELARAARAYRELLLRGIAPGHTLLGDLAQELGVSKSTAAKRIHRARRTDPPLLAATVRGKAGGLSQTVVLEAAVRTRQAQPIKVSTAKKKGNT